MLNRLGKISLVGFVFGVLVVAALAFLANPDDGSVSADTPRQIESVDNTIFDSGESGAQILKNIAASTIAGAYTIDGVPLYEFRTYKRWPIASITKLATAATAYRLFNEDEVVKISASAVSTEGSSGGLKQGEFISVGDLVKAMLVVSSNDAASALAEHYGKELFISEMNKLAKDVGMDNTNFSDPTGLSIQNLSTAEDLVLLARYVWEKEPQLFEITQNVSDRIVDRSTGSERELRNINVFAGRSDFLGGKTGQIPEAEGNLLSVFRKAGMSQPVIIVVLGAEDRFRETERILEAL